MMAMPFHTTDTTISNMDIDSSSSMNMAMTFFSATTTPLFFDYWKPASSLSYSLTCLFLVTLALVLRALIAIKPVLEIRYWDTTSSGVQERDAGRESWVDDEDIEQSLKIDTSNAADHDISHIWVFVSSCLFQRRITELLHSPEDAVTIKHPSSPS